MPKAKKSAWKPVCPVDEYDAKFRSPMKTGSGEVKRMGDHASIKAASKESGKYHNSGGMKY